MKMVQVEFQRKICKGICHTTAWVDSSWNLKEGQVVTFDDDETQWEVAKVGTILQEYAEINRKWEVGGL